MSKRTDAYMQYKGQLVVIQLRDPYVVCDYAATLTVPHADDPNKQVDALDMVMMGQGQEEMPARTTVLTGAYVVGATDDGEKLIVKVSTMKQAIIEIMIDPAQVMFMTRIVKAPSPLLLSSAN